MICGCQHHSFLASVTNGVSDPEAITAGTDGNLWCTDGDKIGKISPKTGKMIEYNLPDTTVTSKTTVTSSDDEGSMWLLGADGVFYNTIISGPDGNLWFTGDGIGKISPQNGKVTRYDIPTANANPVDIAVGADGNLWFTENHGKIGEIASKTGKVTEYPVPNPIAYLGTITAGPDGNLWFTEIMANKIGKISPYTGNVTEYNIPTFDGYPGGITAGPDGNVWFTKGYNIDKISPATGVITEYSIPSAPALGPITVGPDGNLWFITGIGIGKISPATGVITNLYSISDEKYYTCNSITAGPDGNIWFIETSGFSPVYHDFSTPVGYKIGKINPKTGIVSEFPPVLFNHNP